MASAFRAIFFSFILLSGFAARVVAGPLEDSDAAWERQDFATALPLLRPLADQGKAEAQMKLGFMYVTGEGIPQDYAEAVKWFHSRQTKDRPTHSAFSGSCISRAGVFRGTMSAHTCGLA
jgi:TPR repeat protein